MGHWRKVLLANNGSEIAEVAVVLPIVLTLLMAILWFGRAFNIYTTITHAAREGAQVAVVGYAPSCATCAATAPTAANVADRVTQVLQAASIDPNQVAAYTPNPVPTAGTCPGGMTTGTSNHITVYRNAQLNALGSNPPACGVVVAFQYPFNFFLLNPIPPFGRNSFTLRLKADVQMQGEN